MFRTSTTITAVSFCILVAACGGGSGGNDTSSSSENSAGSETPNNTGTSGNNSRSDSNGSTTPNSGSSSTPPTSGSAGESGDGGNAGSETTPLTATATQAPSEGASYLSGTVRLEVSGSGMRNVELLPESGYAPRLGTFNVSSDGTSAYLDLDTRLIPDGGIKLRISAFDKPAGSADAREVVAMPARTWLVNNAGGAINGGLGSPEARAIGCLSLGYSYTGLTDAQPVVCNRWTVASPPVPPEQCTTALVVPYVRPGDSRSVFRNANLVPQSFSCDPAANGGRIPEQCVCRS